MSQLIVTEFITVDGVVEAPGGEHTHPHTGWVGEIAGPDAFEYKLQEVLDAESHLLGRVTYESFAGAWPQREGALAEKINAMPKYVVTATLPEPLEWNNSTAIRGDIANEIEKLKANTEGPILVAGSATLVQFLLDHDLVDELRLMVFPVIIGGGVRIWSDSRTKRTLQLADIKQFEAGVAVHVYERG